VVVCSTIGCGRCSYCRAGYYAPVRLQPEDPVETIKHLTGGPGADRVIDAVGIDAQRPSSGPAAGQLAGQAGPFDAEQRKAAPDADPRGGQWVPGDAPSLAARWAVEAVAKAGSVGIIGINAPEFDVYPVGQAMNKNLTLKMGNCNHRRYVPELLDLVAAGLIDPAAFITPGRKSRPQRSRPTRPSTAVRRAGSRPSSTSADRTRPGAGGHDPRADSPRPLRRGASRTSCARRNSRKMKPRKELPEPGTAAGKAELATTSPAIRDARDAQRASLAESARVYPPFCTGAVFPARPVGGAQNGVSCRARLAAFGLYVARFCGWGWVILVGWGRTSRGPWRPAGRMRRGFRLAADLLTEGVRGARMSCA
jgi:hypothetical protein